MLTICSLHRLILVLVMVRFLYRSVRLVQFSHIETYSPRRTQFLQAGVKKPRYSTWIMYLLRRSNRCQNAQ